MARALWSGTIGFGLVNVPVKLYSAVHDEDIHFSQFDKNGNHIRYKRVSGKTGKEALRRRGRAHSGGEERILEQGGLGFEA